MTTAEMFIYVWSNSSILAIASTDTSETDTNDTEE